MDNIVYEMKYDSPYVKSLLENDLYKYSMGQFVLHRYPRCNVRIDFKCRSDLKIGFLKPVIDKQLDYLCQLRYTDEEIRNLRSIDWLSSDFVDYLIRFYLFRHQIHTDIDNDGQLIMYAEGPWRDVIWFEVMCLAIVEEAYTRCMGKKLGLSIDKIKSIQFSRLVEKVDFLNKLNAKHPFTISEFGLRRRSCFDWEDIVVEYMKDKCASFTGTSNVYLAMKHNVKPSGTMAHELYMGLQGVGIQLRNVQTETWRQWMDEFRGRNGIMLTDIFGAKACFKDLDWYVANSFSGFRHDSGDPIRWGNQLIERLKELGIDPKNKIFVWSDCLNMPTIEKIVNEFAGKVKISFGVGTNLVHDIPEIKPLSIVMKMTFSNGQPVLKLSDDEGKGMCPDQSLVEYAKHVYQYEPI